MASFSNLDESQATSLINTLNQQIQNLDISDSNLNNNLSQVNKAVTEISSNVTNLQQALGSINIGTVSEQFNALLDRFNNLNSVVQSFTQNQIKGTKDVVDQLGYINTLSNTIGDTMEKCKNISFGDPQQMESVITKLKDIKDNYSALTRDNNLLNIDQNNIDQVYTSLQKLFGEMKNIGETLDLGGQISRSINSPEILNNFKNMFETVSMFANQVPQKFQNEMKSSLEQIAQNSQVFSSSQPTQNPTDPVKTQINIDAAVQKAFEESIAKISSVQFNAQELRNNADKVSQNTIKTEDNVRHISNNYDSYSYLERKNMENSGLNKEGLASLEGSLGELLRMASNYKMATNGANSAVVTYENAYKKYQSDPTSQNLVAAQEAGRRVSGFSTDAARISTELNPMISTISKSLVAAYGNYDKLPEDVKKVLDTFKDIEESSKKSSDNILNIAKDFPMQGAEIFDTLKKGIESSNKELSRMEEIFQNMKKDAGSIFDQVKSGFSSFMSGVGNIGGAMRTMGLGVGIPLSGKEALSYIGDITKYYKEFGQMDVNSSLAQYAQGSNSPNQRYLDNNRNIGIEQYRNTYGIIDYKDYANMSNGLMSGIQGHYGDGNNKASGLADMSSISRTAVDLNKLYGVDSQGAISTFYKELNMDAKETENMMLRLADTAQSANIPVGDYVKTVANMAEQFKQAGISAKDVEIGMRNLTMSGMSTSTAQGIMQDTTGAVNKMSNSWGEAAYFGMQAGVSNNPFGAIKSMQDRWDSKGNVKDSAVDATLGAIDKEVSTLSGAWGSGDSKWIGTRSILKQMGYSDQNASMLTNAYVSGNRTSFKDMMTKADKEQEKPPGQKDLEDKLVAAGSKTDELSKAIIQNNTIQMQLAQVNKSLLDMIGKDLQKLVAALGSVMMTLAQGVGKLVEMLGGIGKLLEVYAGGKLFSSGLGKSWAKGLGETAAGAEGGFGSTFMKALKTGGKAIPLIGGLIDGAFTYFDDKGAGKTTGYSAGESIGSGVGTAGGIWAGAAAGAALGSVIPGAGTLIGGGLGLLGGIIGGYGGSWIGKNTADGVMNYAGVQEYESEQNAATQNIKLTGNYAGSTSSSQTYANNDFYGMAGVNPNDFNDNITKTDTILKNNTYAVQTDTNSKIDDMKTKQSNLLEKSNSLSRETYDLNNSKYSDMIDKAKTQLEQLTNIAKITDSGFTFLDKILNDIYNKIGMGSESSGLSGSVADSSGSSNSQSHTTYGSGSGDVNKSLKVSDPTDGLTADDINNWIDKNAKSDSLMKGKGDIFLKAAKETGLDVKYLVAHAAQETGWGAPTDPNGVQSILSKKGNWFGIGAYNASPGESSYGYSNIDAGILQGAEWIKKNYSDAGQDTLWKMIHSNDNHNYAVYDDGSPNTGWMNSIASMMANGPTGSSLSSSSNSSNDLAKAVSERRNQTDVAALESGDYWYGEGGKIVGYGANSGHDYDINTGIDRLADSSNTTSNTATAASTMSNNSDAHYSAPLSTSADTSSSASYQNSSANTTSFSSAPVYVIGSEEYSNGAQKASDISKFHTKDDTVWVNNLQGQARGMALYYDQVTRGQYANSVDYADDYSSVYNSKQQIPNFQINIEANGDGKNYDAMAKQIQDSLTQIVQSFMGSNTNVAASNYQRTMNQF